MTHVVVMVTTSYPRFPGDGVGSFMEPIAKGVAARGHAVHLVAPWHPAITRPPEEDGVRFHFFRYAPHASLNVFGYATGLRADTHLKRSAWLVAPAAMVAGMTAVRRVAARYRATVLHGHWVIPGGAIAAAAAGRRPLVVTLHGSDVYVAERSQVGGRLARYALRRAGWVTACSDDLRERGVALGADPARSETLPYGVDSGRFAPSADVRREARRALGIGDEPLVLAAGRLVRKKGFEYLIDAAARLRREHPRLRVIIAGDGDLRDELAARARAIDGETVRFTGNQPQADIARMAAAADAIAVPSIRDDQGNVDGLPNFALEALASATPVVATTAGGLPQIIRDCETGRLVPERDPAALADALAWLLSDSGRARAIGMAGRARVMRDFGWTRMAARFEAIYDQIGRIES
jgi:glycosyltransferase involved in cell wall biosynthesis